MQDISNLVQAMTKDNFSTQASTYAKFRPMYPKGVFDYLDALVVFKKTQHYIKKKGVNPVNEVIDKLRNILVEEENVAFPLFTKVRIID